MTQLAAQQNALMATLAKRISHLKERPSLDVITPQSTQSTSRPPTEVVRCPKPRLLDLERFDGKDTNTYLQFEGLLRAKLEIDRPAICGEAKRV
jgi:hypothetical protein